MLPTTAEKLQNFFGVFLQFQIGVDSLTADYSAGKILSLYPDLVAKPLEGHPSPYVVTLAYHTNSEKLKILNDFVQWVKDLMLDRN